MDECASWQIRQGDSLMLLKEVESESIDLVMTSPPYAERRKNQYGGIPASEYPDWMLDIVRESMRTLKRTGSFVLNIKEHVSDGVRDTYVFETVLKISREFRWVDTYIWAKTNPFPTGSKKRLKDGFEYCFHFAKTKDYKFYPNNALVPANSRFLESEKRRKSKGVHNTNNGSGMNMSRRVSSSDFVRPSNVISLPTDTSNHRHPATFPEGLPERFIKLMTDSGDIVLDPFVGSGTTGKVAVLLGRRFLGFDINQEYCEMAKARIHEV